jgi:trehalose 6-phosphate phosphatase
VTPEDLAARAAACRRPLLIGLDVDGVLAPIVPRADQAELLPGVNDALAALVRFSPSVSLAVVSGRAVDDLEERYGFPDHIAVVGSHGLERRDSTPLELDDLERHTLDQLTTLATAAANDVGEGAWVEHKPASAVLHVREADDDAAVTAIEQLSRLAAMVPGAHVKHGHQVVELMARRTSKATAVADLRRQVGAASVLFVGDDHTDEEVFADLGPDDVSVRVGGGDTLAAARLPDPDAVLAWLRALPAALDL